MRVQAPSGRRTGHGIWRKAFRPSHLGAIQGRYGGEFSVFVSGCAGIRCIEPYGVSHLGQFSHCVAHVSPEVQRSLCSGDRVDRGSVSGLGSQSRRWRGWPTGGSETMIGSKESGVSKDRRSRLQVQGDHEPGSDIRVMRGRGLRGMRVAIFEGSWHRFRGGHARTERGCSSAKRGCGERRTQVRKASLAGERDSAKAERFVMVEVEPKARPRRDLSESALHGRAARGGERQMLTAHAITAEGCRGSRCSLRAVRWRAAPSRGRAELMLSGAREARAAPARSAAPRCASGGRCVDRGADPHCCTDRLPVSGSAPPWQADAVNGDVERRGRDADRRGKGRSPGRPSRRRSRCRYHGTRTRGARP